MFYSCYLSIYLLQSLNFDLSETQLIQEPYTNMDYVLEDTLFPEDGPVFMQRVHEFRHPVAMSSEEKIQRRLGVSNVPGTKATFKDGLFNDPNYWRKNPIASEIPILKLYDTSVFVPHFDVNPITKENTIQTQNEPQPNEYEELYAAKGTTIKNVEGTPNDKTGLNKAKIDEASPPAQIPNMVNEPNVPAIPKTYDDYYPTGSKSPAQVLDDPLLVGPGLNSRYEINPIDKNIDGYNDLLTEPTFFTQNYDVTQQLTTTKIRRTMNSYDTSFMTKLANFFYPEIETTTELRLGFRTGKGGVFFIKRSNISTSKTIQTKSQTFQGIETNKPTFHVPLKKSLEFKPKVNKGNPITLGTLDFIHNDDINSHDLNSRVTETTSQIARESRKRTPLKKEMDVTYPQNSNTTIEILNQPSRNEPYFHPNVDEYYAAARETEPVHTQDPISPIITRLFRAQLFTSGPSKSSVNTPLNPSFLSNYPEQHETHLTVPNLALSSNERPDVKQKASPESANLSESIQTWAPLTIVYNYRLPTTMLKDYDNAPEIRVHMPELTPLDQKTYTIIKDKPTHYGFITERLPNQEQIRAERFESKDYRAITETLELEKDTGQPAENGLEGEGLSKQEQIRAKNFELKDNRAINERLELEKDAEEAAKSREEGEGFPKQEPIRAEIFESKYNQAVTERLELEKYTKEPAENGEESEGTVPFSTFLNKLMKVLASKNLSDLQFLKQAFERYVKTLVDSEKLTKLGAAVASFVTLSTGALRAPVEEIQRYLLIAQLSLEYRRMLDAGTVEMLNEIDDVYDVSEEEAMQRILHEITLFPNTSRNEEQIIKDFVDDIFLHPVDRVAGTSKGNLVFEHIAKFAEKHMSLVSEYSRRYQKHEGDIFKDISFGEDEELVKDHRRNNEGKISPKNDFGTRSKRKRKRKMVIDLDSSDSRKYESSDDKSGVVIRIRINREKHPKTKYSNNSGKIKNKRFGKQDKKYSNYS